MLFGKDPLRDNFIFFIFIFLIFCSTFFLNFAYLFYGRNMSMMYDRVLVCVPSCVRTLNPALMLSALFLTTVSVTEPARLAITDWAIFLVPSFQAHMATSDFLLGY